MVHENLHATPYDDINRLLYDLLSGVRKALGEKLIGFYLYGSLVWGEFDHSLSDIDTLAVVSSPITEGEAERLRVMHERLSHAYPAWDDRIEVQYQSLEGLRSFRESDSPMAVISPGEPLHIVQAGKEWLLNWYFVRTYGLSLHGPPPESIIGPIDRQEFLSGVREHALEWRHYITNTQNSRAYQGYAILTMCRAYYTLMYGEQVSKVRAALWAQTVLPDYADVIDKALRWREEFRNVCADSVSAYPAARAFVLDMVNRIEQMGRGSTL